LLKAILAYTKTAKVTEKLQFCLNEIIQNKKTPFNMEVFINPNDRTSKTAKGFDRRLIFVEADPKNLMESAYQLEDVRWQFSSDSYQMVLIASTEFDYLDIAMQFGIGNILIEDQFDTPMLNAMILRLLGDDFFGFTPFFPQGFPIWDQTISIEGKIQYDHIAERYFRDFLTTLDSVNQCHFEIYINELLMNALSYGVYGITPEERDLGYASLPPEVFIPKGKEILVRIVQDHEKYGVSVMDNSGSLRSSRILQKIRRHTTFGAEVLPQGIEDRTGRGLFIISRQNRIVINILRKIKTEVILMHFFKDQTNKYQSLIINEKQPEPLNLQSL
jgi:hypothetical protein